MGMSPPSVEWADTGRAGGSVIFLPKRLVITSQIDRRLKIRVVFVSLFDIWVVFRVSCDKECREDFETLESGSDFLT